MGKWDKKLKEFHLAQEQYAYGEPEYFESTSIWLDEVTKELMEISNEVRRIKNA